MRFHVLLPVRDEADIIGQSLRHALQWADAIYVFDTGSLDETWEIVQDFAASDNRVVPVRKEPVYFSETRLRGYLFNVARPEMRDGDWFLRMDADEFHHAAPAEFIKSRLRKHETVVYHQYYDFRLLQSELDAWKRGEETLADRSRPIEERRRHFTINTYSEPRLCKYRRNMQWPPNVAFPFNAGFVARERLPIRHYPHRDPLQLERRCRLRAIMMADPENRAFWKTSFHYWEERDWHKFVTSDDFPELKCWKFGTELPSVHQTNHLQPPHVRLVQRIVHASLLPVLDRLRPRWTQDAYPQRIPPEILARLSTELAISGSRNNPSCR